MPGTDNFSLDDFVDSFWLSPPRDTSVPPTRMNRSQSEWAFEKFIQEMSSDSKVEAEGSRISATVDAAVSGHVASRSSTSNVDEGVVDNRRIQQKPLDQTSGMDSAQNHAYLKSQLNLACAAVALTRSSSGMTGNIVGLRLNQEKGSSSLQLGGQSDAIGTLECSSVGENNGGQVGIPNPPIRQKKKGVREAESGQVAIPTFPARQKKLGVSKDDSGPVGIPALPARQKKIGIQGRQTTSESSKEDSDDDEVEGSNEILDNMDPAKTKRARRMLSNRESARRSRRRKHEQMNELETQVGQLKVENSTLLKRLSDINHECDEAVVDNRVLKADTETLRAKVKMAEETVKRLTGVNPFVSMNKVLGFSKPCGSNLVIKPPASVTSQVQQDQNSQIAQQPFPSVAVAASFHSNMKGGFNSSTSPLARNQSNDIAMNGMVGMSSLQNVADAQHMQNHIRYDDQSSRLPAVWQPDMSHVVAKKS